MKIFSSLIIAVILSSAAYAQDAKDLNATLDQLNLGEYWYGTKIDKADLVGKVVLVEIWGS